MSIGPVPGHLVSSHRYTCGQNTMAHKNIKKKKPDTMEISVEFLWKKLAYTLYDLAILFVGMYPQNQSQLTMNPCVLMFTAALLPNVQVTESVSVSSTDQCIKSN